MSRSPSNAAEGQGSSTRGREAGDAGQARRSTARRIAISRLRDADLVKKLIDVLAPRYKTRNGGYTRIMKAGFRPGDNAAMAVIEFVDRDVEAKGRDSGPAPTPPRAEGRLPRRTLTASNRSPKLERMSEAEADVVAVRGGAKPMSEDRLHREIKYFRDFSAVYSDAIRSSNSRRTSPSSSCRS